MSPKRCSQKSKTEEIAVKKWSNGEYWLQSLQIRKRWTCFLESYLSTSFWSRGWREVEEAAPISHATRCMHSSPSTAAANILPRCAASSLILASSESSAAGRHGRNVRRRGEKALWSLCYVWKVGQRRVAASMISRLPECHDSFSREGYVTKNR